MRNYSQIENYLRELQADIYDQSADETHTAWAEAAINTLIPSEDLSVLDIGCGTGFCRQFFEMRGCSWVGTSLGKEADDNASIDKMDMSFLDYSSGKFDLIFARHVLEHSPMPLLTLKEWHRVSKKWAIIILPSPDYWGVGGRNHYYVLDKKTWWALFDFAGWEVDIHSEFDTANEMLWSNYYPSKTAVDSGRGEKYPLPPKTVEYWFLLKKKS